MFRIYYVLLGVLMEERFLQVLETDSSISGILLHVGYSTSCLVMLDLSMMLISILLSQSVSTIELCCFVIWNYLRSFFLVLIICVFVKIFRYFLESTLWQLVHLWVYLVLIASWTQKTLSIIPFLNRGMLLLLVLSPFSGYYTLCINI